LKQSRLNAVPSDISVVNRCLAEKDWKNYSFAQLFLGIFTQ